MDRTSRNIPELSLTCAGLSRGMENRVRQRQLREELEDRLELLARQMEHMLQLSLAFRMCAIRQRHRARTARLILASTAGYLAPPFFRPPAPSYDKARGA